MAGWCQLTQDAVNNSDVNYLHQVWEGTCLRMQAEERSRLIVARWQNVYVYNGYAKYPVKPSEPDKLFKFKWEEKPQKKLTTQQAQHLKQYEKIKPQ